MTLKRTIDPLLQPVSLATLQAHVRREPGEDDVFLQHCLDVAVGQFDGDDGELGRALITQTWEETYAVVPAPGGAVELTLAPVSALAKVEVYTSAESWEEIAVAEAELFEDAGRYLVAADWLRPGKHRAPLRITYVAGYGEEATSVPPQIIHAILLFAAHLYEVREPVSFEGTPVEVPLSIARLVANHKTWWR